VDAESRLTLDLSLAAVQSREEPTMCIPQEALKPGAYLLDPSTRQFYEVATVDERTTCLIDARSPVDEPELKSWLTVNVLKRLELFRHAPNLDDVASVAEFGPLG
jgi:hypothetical protein